MDPRQFVQSAFIPLFALALACGPDIEPGGVDRSQDGVDASPATGGSGGGAGAAATGGSGGTMLGTGGGAGGSGLRDGGVEASSGGTGGGSGGAPGTGGGGSDAGAPDMGVRDASATGGMGGSGGGGAGGARDAGVETMATGGSGAGGAPAACPAWLPTGTIVSETASTAVLPAATGGAVANGTYHLTGAVRYFGPAGGTTTDKFKWTLILSGVSGSDPSQTGRMEAVRHSGFNTDGSTKKEERFTFTFATMKTSMGEGKFMTTQTCPPGPGGVPVVSSARYNSVGGVLTFLDPNSADPTTGKSKVYTKM